MKSKKIFVHPVEEKEDSSWSRKDMMELVNFWSKKSREQEEEIETLEKFLEKKKLSRYGKCFRLYKEIAIDRKFGDDNLGYAVAKNKVALATKIKYLKSLSSSELKSLEDFLDFLLRSGHLPITAAIYQVWKNNLDSRQPDRVALNFILQFKEIDYLGEKVNLLVAQIASLRDNLLD